MKANCRVYLTNRSGQLAKKSIEELVAWLIGFKGLVMEDETKNLLLQVVSKEPEPLMTRGLILVL
jgi:hypothetical protein